MDGGRQQETALTRLAVRRPQLAGIVAAMFWGGSMMIFFDLLTLFRDVRTMAFVWSLGGAFFGIAMGWYWSYTKRMGQPPNVM